MILDTIPAYLKHWATTTPDRVWLRDLKDSKESASWTWAQAYTEVSSVASQLEQKFGHGNNMVILSKNRAHWILADNAVIASGNVTVSMFTTLPQSTAEYVLNFTEASVIFVGEAENWEKVQSVLPPNITIVALPGVELSVPHLTWNDLVAAGDNQQPNYECKSDDLMSLVFTSGTTGVPKGVMQTHETNLVPMQRAMKYTDIGQDPRFLSYLPLSHIAERQLVEYTSMIMAGTVNFNENLTTLLPDLQATRPVFFFGPPRVWEQFQQAIIAKFGSQAAVEQALEQDKAGIGKLVIENMGLDQVRYCLTAAAPTPPALIKWFEEFGLTLLEGFGQTEAMALILSDHDNRRIGSIGKAIEDVEYRLSEEDELLIKASACTPGYYKMPEKTDELWIDGWLHTGDKARVDEDGFIFLTGRVKDYFKTIQGKFVAPTPIENIFSSNDFTEQQCLLGRGYSKPVVTCVLGASAATHDSKDIEAALLERVQAINESVEKHAKVGAVIISKSPWTIENEILTPTMKIKREKIEEKFGELARDLSTQSAEKGEILFHWFAD